MLGPNPKILAYLFASEELNKARKASEAARASEEKASKDLWDAKQALAKEFSYVGGAPPIVIVVDNDRVIRLTSRERDRGCGRSDDTPEILATVEKAFGIGTT